MNRASPADLRKALEIAQLYVRMGINFVPVPFTTVAEQSALAAKAILKLDQMEVDAKGVNDENP